MPSVVIRYPSIHPVHQLTGVPLGGKNCGPATGAMLVDFATGGRVRFQAPAVRQLMGDTGPGGLTDLVDMKTAIELHEVTTAARNAHVEALKLRVEIHGDFEGLRQALGNENACVALILRYREVNEWDQQHHSHLSGDPSWQGNHIVAARQLRNLASRPGPEVRVFDPLDDRRRAGIPLAPIWWPLQLVRLAMLPVTDHNGHDYAVIHRAARILADPAGQSEAGVK